MKKLVTRPLEELESRIGHSFKTPNLLESALTHPSLSGTVKGKASLTASAYERLEFLGDRVLGLVMAEWLYTFFPAATEGELAKHHAALVNRDALKKVAIRIDLAAYLRLAHGDGSIKERQNLAALSDATEAVIGALYLDGGLEPAKAFIRRFWVDLVDGVASAPADPKTALQEWAQGRGLPLPIYRIVSRSGPAHAPVFEIEASVQGKAPMVRCGASKREAEKAAAQALLESMDQT